MVWLVVSAGSGDMEAMVAMVVALATADMDVEALATADMDVEALAWGGAAAGENRLFN